jgi:organic radical activating enzyme
VISSPVVIPKIEFYITNVCNLNCNNCNRFNNHNFKGWQRWSDYADIYAEWAKRIEINQIIILGGEPLLNPTIIDWIKGLNEVWPNGTQILTNGTRLNYVDGLYNLLVDRIQLSPGSTYPDWKRGRNFIGVSLHNEVEKELIFEEINKFLKHPITKTEGKDKNEFGADYVFMDANGVKIPVWEQDVFTKAAIQLTSDKKFVLYNNTAEEAHAICGFAQNKNYHFIHGKLYKCGPAALFPEFDNQHTFDNIDESDRKLLNSYVPLSVDRYDTVGQEFLKNIDNPIPQCKFCPDRFSFEKIHAISKSRCK